MPAAKQRTLPAALAAHRWQPGQSGNPSGHSGDYGDAIRLARQAAPDAVRRLIELMGSDDDRVAAIACNAILDRAFGKPAPAVDPPIEKMPLREIVDRLTCEQLTEFAAELRALPDRSFMLNLWPASTSEGETGEGDQGIENPAID